LLSVVLFDEDCFGVPDRFLAEGRVLLVTCDLPRFGFLRNTIAINKMDANAIRQIVLRNGGYKFLAVTHVNLLEIGSITFLFSAQKLAHSRLLIFLEGP